VHAVVAAWRARHPSCTHLPAFAARPGRAGETLPQALGARSAAGRLGRMGGESQEPTGPPEPDAGRPLYLPRPEPGWSRAEVEIALASDDVETARNGLLAAAFDAPDWRWAQEQCLRFLAHPVLRGLAVICFGHVAMMHKQLDYERIVPLLQRIRREEPDLAGSAYDALTDIQQFVPAAHDLKIE